ncbi:MAG: riboflavin biosynthesis protein RibF [Erysipelotrichaceae bacterium]|nr:riboflavin biosynthesis protein RibF [Erysipelotrichaceae bacterium]
MDVFYLSGQIEAKVQKLCLAIGFFDGLHIGHQTLIQEVLKIAEEKQLIPAVMTFNRHPLEVLTGRRHNYLTTLEDRLTLIRQCGIQEAYVIEFSPSVARLSPQEFIDRYLMPLGVEHIVCGEDFHFGDHGLGNAAFLKTQPFAVSVMPPVMYDDHQKVSSTLIKQFLAEGQVEEANRLLSRPLSMTGQVIYGKQRGRLMGFPTANISDEGYTPLKRGVYAVEIDVKGQTYHGMANIGMNPTFNDLIRQSLEVHIFDFDDNIYGEIVTIRFYTHTRDEKQFASIDELTTQLHKDLKMIRNYFSKA